MYVIFPADEIILLSYGYAQSTRFQPRPTLDNLQDPIVPIGIRPSTNSNLDVHSNHISLSRQNSSPLRSSINSRTSVRRDPSPNVSFADDFMSKSRASVVEESLFRADDNNFGSARESNNLEAGEVKKKGKLKSKFSKISLGKLGRPSSNEQNEPVSARLREDLEIRVTNPTFTHDNLRQKNFDAFFASGASVYSLERKDKQFFDNSLLTPTTPQSAATTIDTPSSFAASPTTPSSVSSRKNSISAFFTPKFASKPPSPSVNNSSGKRPKSAELYRSTEGSVKGDRCPIHRFWWIKEFFAVSSAVCWFSSEIFARLFFLVRFRNNIFSVWNGMRWHAPAQDKRQKFSAGVSAHSTKNNEAGIPKCSFIPKTAHSPVQERLLPDLCVFFPRLTYIQRSEWG